MRLVSKSNLVLQNFLIICLLYVFSIAFQQSPALGQSSFITVNGVTLTDGSIVVIKMGCSKCNPDGDGMRLSIDGDAVFAANSWGNDRFRIEIFDAINKRIKIGHEKKYLSAAFVQNGIDLKYYLEGDASKASVFEVGLPSVAPIEGRALTLAVTNPQNSQNSLIYVDTDSGVPKSGSSVLSSNTNPQSGTNVQLMEVKSLKYEIDGQRLSDGERVYLGVDGIPIWIGDADGKRALVAGENPYGGVFTIKVVDEDTIRIKAGDLFATRFSYLFGGNQSIRDLALSYYYFASNPSLSDADRSEYSDFDVRELSPGYFQLKEYLGLVRRICCLNTTHVSAVVTNQNGAPGETGVIKITRVLNSHLKVLKLDNLEVEDTTDIGQDEVYLKITVDGITKRVPPENGSQNGTKKMDEEDPQMSRWGLLSEFVGSNIEVEVWEDDDGSNPDDHLGTLTVDQGSDNGLGSKEFSDSGNGKYKLNYEIRNYIGDHPDFVMVFASDPQFGYCNDQVVCSIRYLGSDVDKSIKANELHSDSMLGIVKDLEKNGKDFQGVVINGDLTNEVGSSAAAVLEHYNKLYLNKFTVFPGLGNHDTSNYDNEQKDNVIDRLKDFADMVRSLPAIGQFDVTIGAADGSYAYYWDVGHYRFIQLNNSPAYSVNLGKGYVVNASVSGWLNEILNKSTDKIVIINMHMINVSEWGQGDKGYAEFQKILGQYKNVKGIFAGHIHCWIGTYKLGNDCNKIAYNAINVTKNSGAQIQAIDSKGSFLRNVPIFFGGSASFNVYLKVTFGQRQFDVEVIDSIDGIIGKNLHEIVTWP